MNGVILSKSDEKCTESLGLSNNKNEIVTLDGTTYFSVQWREYFLVSLATAYQIMSHSL